MDAGTAALISRYTSAVQNGANGRNDSLDSQLYWPPSTNMVLAAAATWTTPASQQIDARGAVNAYPTTLDWTDFWQDAKNLGWIPATEIGGSAGSGKSDPIPRGNMIAITELDRVAIKVLCDAILKFLVQRYDEPEKTLLLDKVALFETKAKTAKLQGPC